MKDEHIWVKSILDFQIASAENVIDNYAEMIQVRTFHVTMINSTKHFAKSTLCAPTKPAEKG